MVAMTIHGLLFVMASLQALRSSSAAQQTDDQGGQVISMLSKLLLQKEGPNGNTTRSTGQVHLRGLKIELDFTLGSEEGSQQTFYWKRVRGKGAGAHRKKRAIHGRADDVGLALLIPTKYIVVVKIGVPVTSLNQSVLLQLRGAFAVELGLPVENVNIDKIRYHGNDIEMFFVQPDTDPLVFTMEDLIESRYIVQPSVLERVKSEVPDLNITSITMQHEVVFTSYPQPFWMQLSFRYVMGACGAVMLILTVSLIYCCCKKKEKTLKETDDAIRASQTVFYPSVKPDTKNPLMIQPGAEPVYIPTGCVTPIRAQPIRAFKTKGLLERRGSSASLKIKLSPCQPNMSHWDGSTPPKQCTGLEYLTTAGNRLSRQDLHKAVKNPRALHQEFWEVPMNHPDKISVAGSGMKNRYRTIIPIEHSRVILPNSELDPLSSYINANYIQGYEGEKQAYIATQGPLPHSIVDFWHMVWNQKSPIIVMITNLKEKNKVKCENYLPEDDSYGTFGDIEVKVDRIIQRNGYIVRQLILKCEGESVSVLHYWYTTWPDHKPPDCPTTIVELVKEVEARRFADNNLAVRGPVIVHCSAGIGRTGCFIAISIGIRQLKEEQSVDVLGIVCSMRLDRGGMIQTHEQYDFVHQALCQYERELEAEPSPSPD